MIPPQKESAVSLFAEDEDGHRNCLAWRCAKTEASRASRYGCGEFLDLNETPSGGRLLIDDLLQARSEILA